MEDWVVEPSKLAMAANNNIRINVVKYNNFKPKSRKPHISCAGGDPGLYPHLKVSQHAIDSMSKTVLGVHNGYDGANGFKDTKQAILNRYKKVKMKTKLSDVYVTSGASHAINMAIGSIMNPGQTMLLSKPTYTYYMTMSGRYNIPYKLYNLMPDNNWDIDVKHLESLIDDTTKIIVVCNPNNPCGSVLSKQNMLDVLAVAYKHKLVIVTDETYRDFVFDSAKFYSFAELSTNVPILTISGASKTYLVPGWRFGWVIVHDPTKKYVKGGVMRKVKPALWRLGVLNIGVNRITQKAMVNILNNTPQSYYDNICKTIQTQSLFLYNSIQTKLGKYIRAIEPKGAMYVMCKINVDMFKDIKNDDEFVHKFMDEQNVLVLPGYIFNADNYLRIVTLPPIDVLTEVVNRMIEFCNHHSKIISSKL